MDRCYNRGNPTSSQVVRLANGININIRPKINKRFKRYIQITDSYSNEEE